MKLIKFNKTIPVKGGYKAPMRKGQTINGQKLIKGSITYTPGAITTEMWFENKTPC